MSEKFTFPKTLENYINTGVFERAAKGKGGSTFQTLIKAVPGIFGGFVGAAIGWVTANFLVGWVAGWFSKTFTEAELRALIQQWNINPAFQDILTFENLKATENESRGAGTILDDVYGKQCVSATEKNTVNDIVGFINNYIEDVEREAERLAAGYRKLSDWWNIESARLIAQGNENRQTWFSMYNALVGRKCEIILSRIEEVLGEGVNGGGLPPEPPPNGKPPFEFAGITFTPAVMLLVAAGVIFLFSQK